MVKEAEEFAEQDKLVKAKVDARNGLETYCYNLKNMLDDKEKLQGKLAETDAQLISDTVQDTLDWMDDNQDAEKDEYEDKLKDI